MRAFFGASGASTEAESILALVLGMSLDKFTLLRWRIVYNGSACLYFLYLEMPCFLLQWTCLMME
jgi:hypothetical protein